MKTQIDEKFCQKFNLNFASLASSNVRVDYADGMKNSEAGFSTRAIHEGYDALDYHGALNPPVFLTSTYAFERSETGSDRFAGAADGYIYGRVGNPTVTVLEKRMASL